MSRFVLLLPAVTIFILFLVIPILVVLVESFRTYVPGRIGAVAGTPLSLENYTELFAPAYIQYFLQTYLLSFCASILAIFLAFPVAYYIARKASSRTRKVAITAVIGLMFLSSVARVYAIQLTFGSGGVLVPVTRFLGINTNDTVYIAVVVIAGLLHYAVPMSILVLIGSVQNLNPRLTEAAKSLGASALTCHLTVTIPLCIKGIVSAFMISMTLGVSAFVIPLVVGRGRVLFISNLIYTRFSEIANYPSGAAISIVMMVLSILLLFIFSRLTSLLDRT
ncbi:MAG: ABC transporter permease subunit [Mesorhizobium sp.]|nr:MAG: ABC transporter permease subunit [Mesorhizobium sp.]